MVNGTKPQLSAQASLNTVAITCDLGVDPAEVGEAGLDARIAADPLEQPAALVLRFVENVVAVGEEIAGGPVALRLETLGKPRAIPWHQEHRLLLVAVKKKPALLVYRQAEGAGNVAHSLACEPFLGAAAKRFDDRIVIDCGEKAEMSEAGRSPASSRSIWAEIRPTGLPSRLASQNAATAWAK